ncbi:MAG: thiamine phosphate synthase [Bacteroidota bacterium]
MNTGPRLLLLANAFTDPAQAARIHEAVAAGIPWVQFRDHAAPDALFAEAAEACAARWRRVAPDLRVSVNTRLAVAEGLGVGGHVGTRGPSVAEARQRLGPRALLGASVHSVAEAVAACGDGADYVVASPIFTTSSKPGHPGQGVAWLQAVAEAVAPCPVFALGGVTVERVGPCLAAGAYGVALLSGILAAEDVAAAVHAYRAAVRSG